MPICIPDGLPARAELEREGVAVMAEDAARRQDIRPLRIGLLNLMPNKIRTETQIARLVGATPLQVEMTLVRIGGHQAKNTPEEHLLSFYRTWSEVSSEKFDGFIITGAPIELLDYEDVTYWEELTRILDWTCTHVHSSFFICWGAMAAVRHFYGIPKHTLSHKASGIYRHSNLCPASPYLSGFSDDFALPVSRWTEVRRSDVESHKNLTILMESDETGPCLISDSVCRRLYMFNHIEYDSTSLAEEYDRDVKKDSSTRIPKDYFLDDDPNNEPLNRWRSHAHLLFGNWINQTYQTVPFDIENIGENSNNV